MSGKGRGRGEAAAVARTDEPTSSSSSATSRTQRSSGDSPPEPVGERSIRGRGGLRAEALDTRPNNPEHNQRVTKIEPTSTEVQVLCNFVRLDPMKEKNIYQYRVDYEPIVEAVPLRRQVFLGLFKPILGENVTFDGMSDARSSILMDKPMSKECPHPADPNTTIKVMVKKVGDIKWSSFEMLRLYNMNMKRILHILGFHNIAVVGGYLNPELVIKVGNNQDINMIRGFRTAAGVHMQDAIMMNLEPVHKIMQCHNLLQLFSREIARSRSDQQHFRNNIRSQYVGKIVMTQYNKRVYKIEDINFGMNPESTFRDHKNNVNISYLSYFQSRYGVTIRERSQPLILAVPNNKRRNVPEEQEHDIYLIPELCSLAGLTDQQRNDSRVKIDLIRSSQISPQDRVRHMQDFLNALHRNADVEKLLSSWGYRYEKSPVSCKARILARERICTSKDYGKPHLQWDQTDDTASFERLVTSNRLAKAPNFQKMAVIFPSNMKNNEQQIMGGLQRGFNRVGLTIKSVETLYIPNDSPQSYVQRLKTLPQDVQLALVIVEKQDKGKYDAIKKFAACERGLITQVVTSRLMTDDRKAGGASVKIAIQVAAKIGGEPWNLHIPLKDAMICGYDTYHDTSSRGRSFGAFVASMNEVYSKYYSKADCHDKLDELSAHLTENMMNALRKWKELNKKFPTRVIIYRDGVSDAQLEHVFTKELEQVKSAIAQTQAPIQVAFVVVNKRIGARFFMKTRDYINCPPGTVIDNTVTKPNRYDFYLISQSTRFGTLTPTYYNIIHDTTSLMATHQQTLAYKLSLYYFNWTGSVRVPAPCQYAHKLALLCGEHLHTAPDAGLDDYLHYL